MTEYIKRKDAIQAAKHAWAKGLEPSQYIEIISAADVAPVKHGKWVHDGQRVRGGVDWYHCSECGRREAGVYVNFPFCCKCGAMMNLED